MKHSITHRLLAALLIVVMLASLLPAISLTAGARAPIVRNIATADELKQYLEADGDYDLVLTKDISKYIDNYLVWCTVRGNKRLDMHGYDIDIHQDEGKETSYLFDIPKDANLTVYDSANTDAQATIEYKAYIHGGVLGLLTYYRHLFSVAGKLTLNNVKCVAGRAKTEYNPYYAKTVYKQTYGSAVVAYGSGYVEINGAFLSGHPHPEHTPDTPVIAVREGSTVVFNIGTVHGYGRAQCFNVQSGASLRVANGIFDSGFYSVVQWGLREDAGKQTSPGLVALTSEDLAPDALTVYEGDSLSESSSVVVYSPNYELKIEAASGDSHLTDGVTHYRLLNSAPVLKVQPFFAYFHTLLNDSPRAEHVFDTTWRLFDGSVQIGEKFVRGTIPTFNLMTDIPNFTPEQNKAYRVTCEICEIVGPGTAQARCWRYSGDYFALVTDALNAPTIERGPGRSLLFTPGGSVSMSVEASGDNLKYQWYRSHAGGRPSAVTGRSATTRTLTLYDLTEEYNGDYFFCIVSNSQGQVQSSSCKLEMNRLILEIPVLVEQPMHGVPLDGFVEMDVPGLKLTNVRWAGRSLVSISPFRVTYPTLSNSVAAYPYAGETVYLCVTIQTDDGVSVAPDVKVTALGQESVSSEQISDNETEYRIPLVVDAEGNMKIDTVHLTFGSSGPPEVGQEAGSLYIQSCGYSRFTNLFLDRDVRYSIEEDEWLEDGLSVEFPEVKQNHTYTLKVRLKASDKWIFTEDTVVLLDGEEIDYEFANQNAKYWITFEKTFTMMENPFDDVTENDYFFRPVLWAFNHEPQVTTGTSASMFSPNKTCTRAQVVTFLWRANGSPEPTKHRSEFADVFTGDYYAMAVDWAVEQEITRGVDEWHFAPNSPCTRAQVATFLWRAAGRPEPKTTVNPFIDVPADQYYYKAVLWAVENRITNGTSANKFSPNSPCTRGQIVTFLYRAVAEKNKLVGDDFLMYVEDVFSITGRGVLLTGRVENGVLHPGDELTVFYRTEEGGKFETSCTTIEIYQKVVEEAEAGDNIGLLIRGGSKSMFQVGDAVVGASVPMTPIGLRITGTLHLYTKEEGRCTSAEAMLPPPSACCPTERWSPERPPRTRSCTISACKPWSIPARSSSSARAAGPSANSSSARSTDQRQMPGRDVPRSRSAGNRRKPQVLSGTWGSLWFAEENARFSGCDPHGTVV